MKIKAKRGLGFGKYRKERVHDMEKKFLIVDQAILPEVFSKVLKAKELLASGSAKNVSAATKMVDLSRSAFYKYKDSIFDFENTKAIVTVKAVLLDETGALQSLLSELSASGASIVTINQSAPENGTAVVSVTIRTDSMPMPLDDVLRRIQTQRTVVSVHRNVKEIG